MMSDLATAAKMRELEDEAGTDETEATLVVEEILANAHSRDGTRDIGF